MMKQSGSFRKKVLVVFMASLIGMGILAGHVFAQLAINILAVNATEQEREKDIYHILPKELKMEHILDTGGLDVKYDVEKDAFAVYGKVTLQPKESRTYKVRVKDVWRIEQQQVEEIKEQINLTIKRLAGSEYEERAGGKKERLINRLDFIFEQQKKNEDDVSVRIEQYGLYADELAQIRNDAVSVKYWRSEDPAYDQNDLLRFIVEVENNSEKAREIDQKHYLPPEVKPEHLVEIFDFAFRYDVLRKQPYLAKKEELQAGEKKRYEFTVYDVWTIPSVQIENLKNRTRNVYALLENTEYKATADYLVASIKEKLERIEASQAIEKAIQDHVGDYKINKGIYEKAENDVAALEDLLEALRENLERSRLKNALQRIKSLKSLADIAEAIFGQKPPMEVAWKIIIGIMIFVGFLTVVHYIVWGQRSKSVKLEDISEEKKTEKTEEKSAE